MNRHVFIILGCIATLGLSAAPTRNGAVEAELVSSISSIQPGKPFTVALRMQHDPHWHTYWVNPGTGLATSLEWNLPEGFKVGAIEWPVPRILSDASGKVTGYGYEGENFLLVTVTPPSALAVGANVTLKAHAEWLMCEEVCMPGQADVSIRLPVKAEIPVTDEKWAGKIADFKTRLPAGMPFGWSADATRKGATVELHLKIADGARPLANTLYFFSTDELIDHEQPQTVKIVPDGYIFYLPIAEPTDAKTDRLTGVIRADRGWEIPGGTVGLNVDVPLRR